MLWVECFCVHSVNAVSWCVSVWLCVILSRGCRPPRALHVTLHKILTFQGGDGCPLSYRFILFSPVCGHKREPKQFGQGSLVHSNELAECGGISLSLFFFFLPYACGSEAAGQSDPFHCRFLSASEVWLWSVAGVDPLPAAKEPSRALMAVPVVTAVSLAPVVTRLCGPVKKNSQREQSQNTHSSLTHETKTAHSRMPSGILRNSHWLFK